MTRAVVDTNVLVAGLGSLTGASHYLLRLLGRSVQPVLSVPLVLEYEAVLRREARRLRLSVRQITGLVDHLCRIGDKRAIHFLWRPSLRDPRDEMVLELAVAAGCRYIVTFNVRDFAEAVRFELDVMTPPEFLLALGG